MAPRGVENHRPDLSYRLIDRLTLEVDFPSELRKGNVAVAIVIASIFIAISIIIGRALN